MEHIYSEDFIKLSWAQTEKAIRNVANSLCIVEDQQSRICEIKVNRLWYTDWEIIICTAVSYSNCKSEHKLGVYVDPEQDRFEITPCYAYSEHTTNDAYPSGPKRYHVRKTYSCKPRDTKREACQMFINNLKQHFIHNRKVWKDIFMPGDSETFGNLLLDVNARSMEILLKAFEPQE